MDSQERPRSGGAGCAVSLFLIVTVLLFLGAMLNGCGRPWGGEPAAGVPAVVPDAAEPLVLAATAPALPTSAPTLTPPPLPTALPTLDPAIVAAAAVVQATQTAAVSPPTPPIVASATADVPPTAAPMPTPSGVYSWTLKVPILMYHYISEPPPDADVYRLDLSVTPDQFRQQLAWLKENGYATIDLYDLSQAIVNHAELPAKPVLLTFDDGYVDIYQNAFPILQEFGYQGTFFIITDFIDKGREGYLTWPMIEEMARAGHRIESHSRTHPDLRGLPRDALIWEILGSQETLAAHIGYTPRYFCYPGGDYDDATLQILRELDFWGAVTTAYGSWHGFDDRFEWPRIRISNTTTIEELPRLLDLEGTVGGKPAG